MDGFVNIKEIKTLEKQSKELIENINLIKKELNNKISTQAHFEKETVKIVNSLTQVVREFSTIKTLFQSLGDSEMINLFSEIQHTHSQLKMITSEFERKLDHGLSEIESVTNRFEGNGSTIFKELSNHINEITISTKRIESIQQEAHRQFELLNGTTHHSLQLLELKITEYEKANSEKINWILDKLNDNEKSYNNLSEKTDKIVNWLETNGEVLIANSRTGIFGRKK